MSRSARLFSSRRRAATVVLGAAATLVLPLLIGTTAVASATVYRQWTLSGVTFDDGGTLSGTLVIADDGTPQNFDVTTSGGNTGTFGTNHYTGTPSPFGGDGPANGWYLWAPNQVAEQYLNLFLPDTTSAAQGDTLPLATPNKSWECTNCASIRYINAGSIVAGDTVDLTAPDINFSVDPANPDGNHGWYIGNPTVTFTVTDPDSEITNETGCDPQTLDEDNEDFEVTCEATSGGGTNSSTVFLRRDATAPTLAPGVSPEHVLLNGRVTVVPNADDATSGVAVSRCTSSAHVAGYTVIATCRATDVAGNSTVATVHGTVEYVMTPLAFSGKHQVGHQLHVATQLTDATGHPISDHSAAALGCQVKFTMSGAQNRQGCLTYDRSSNQFAASWTLKQHGSATVSVAVSYAQSSVKTTRSKAITIAK
jgi:hypothetical protein